MKRWALGLLLCGLTAGCNTTPDAPHGSPVLTAVYWVTPSGRSLIYGLGTDAAVATTVSAAGSEIDFVFDRRLDGARIEDSVGNTTVPKANPPVTVAWPVGPAAAAPTPFADVFYNSVAAFGDQSSYVFMRPRLAGFPSETMVTFHLDPNGLTSAYGEPMQGPTEVTVTTGPMQIRPRASQADALETFPRSYMFPVAFTNRPAPSAMLLPYAHARAGGVDLPIALAADATDPTVVYVSPAACLGGWPAGATIDVSFARGVPDAFGVPTGGTLPAGSFVVAGAADAGAESGCPGPTDAGSD